MSSTVIESTFRIKYTTDNQIPIPDIVRSLRSIERTLMRTDRFVEKAYPGIKISSVEVYISNMHEGSFVKDFIIKYVVGGEENYKKAKEVIECAIQENEGVKTATAIGVGALLAYGAINAFHGDAPPEIVAHQSVVLQSGGDINLSASDISQVLDSITDKKSLAKESVDIIRPSKADGSTIEIGNIPNLTIPASMVNAVPSEYEPPIPEEKEERYKSIKVFIYASDRDSSSRGWAGAIEGFDDKRTKIELSENINPRDLHGRTSTQANVSLTSKYDDKTGQYVPILITINSTLE